MQASKNKTKPVMTATPKDIGMIDAIHKGNEIFIWGENELPGMNSGLLMEFTKCNVMLKGFKVRTHTHNARGAELEMGPDGWAESHNTLESINWRAQNAHRIGVQRNERKPEWRALRRSDSPNAVAQNMNKIFGLLAVKPAGDCEVLFLRPFKICIPWSKPVVFFTNKILEKNWAEYSVDGAYQYANEWHKDPKLQPKIEEDGMET